MTFGEKLRETRKAAGFSQEELAEKLNVSRQAITKWESDTGLPDISNIMTISKLFSIPVDDLISEEKTAVRVKSRLYESVTEYDIDGKKNFDIKLGGAKEITISGSGISSGTEGGNNEAEGEKIKVILSSDTISTLQQDFKTKIDDIKGRIDIDVNRAKAISETSAKEALYIEVILPTKYLRKIEVAASCKKISATNLTCENLEFDGRSDEVYVDGFKGTFEINCNLDMNIEINSFCGSVEVNQIKATSRMTVSEAQDFKAITKGIATSIIFDEKESDKSVETKESDEANTTSVSSDTSENIIELNGLKSELIICRK
jgi:transcriptional regulator with XRE-family HTH domain